MSEPERTDGGEFATRVRVGDVLGVFEAVRGPVVTASDVADELGCSAETARRKLASLREEGVVDTRTAGRTALWWRTAAGRGDIDPSDPFWDAEPATPDGPEDVSERVDEHLVGIDRGTTPGDDTEDASRDS